MKIAIIGATGKVGAAIVLEALRRGHFVTGIVRDPETTQVRDGLRFVRGDANQPQELASLITGHDVVVSSVPFVGSSPGLLIDAVRRSGVKRYLIVGGAGSLFTAGGALVLDAPGFPESARAEATRGEVFLDVLRTIDDLDWTMLSPSALFTAGNGTGAFRLGEDTLLTAADGKSWISFDDYAIGMLDEIETPMHRRRRFTIGY